MSSDNLEVKFKRNSSIIAALNLIEFTLNTKSKIFYIGFTRFDMNMQDYVVLTEEPSTLVFSNYLDSVGQTIMLRFIFNGPSFLEKPTSRKTYKFYKITSTDISLMKDLRALTFVNQNQNVSFKFTNNTETIEAVVDKIDLNRNPDGARRVFNLLDGPFVEFECPSLSLVTSVLSRLNGKNSSRTTDYIFKIDTSENALRFSVSEDRTDISNLKIPIKVVGTNQTSQCCFILEIALKYPQIRVIDKILRADMDAKPRIRGKLYHKRGLQLFFLYGEPFFVGELTLTSSNEN